MYSNRQSVMFWWRRSCGQKHFRTGIEPANRVAIARLTGRSRCTPNRQSPCVFKKPNEGLPRAAFQRYGRPCRRSKPPIVDRPVCLGETPAPFTSQSPGIATLGPSCTPSRQLGMLFQKALNEVSSRRCSWHQVHSLGCSPDRQLSVSCDLPTKE